MENDGVASSSIVWGDLMHGRGATFGHANSAHRSKYEYCLTLEMVGDLKIAAVIHGYYPALIKSARLSQEGGEPSNGQSAH